MNLESSKIKSFTQLFVWQEGHTLALRIYAITSQFPSDEMFGLISQMRRAGVSITSNIVEGFSRNSYKEKTQFYTIALGSLTEIQNQLWLTKDLHLIKQEIFTELANQTISVNKLLNGLIKKTKSLIPAS